MTREDRGGEQENEEVEIGYRDEQRVTTADAVTPLYQVRGRIVVWEHSVMVSVVWREPTCHTAQNSEQEGEQVCLKTKCSHTTSSSDGTSMTAVALMCGLECEVL